MALFPQGLSHVDARCNASERRVLHQLRRCLEDDYIVWHDVAIGPKPRQPDFVVLSPRWDVLLLEVKDWRAATLGPATRDAVELRTPRGPVAAPHPLRQARDYALELVDLMQHDPALVHERGPFAGRLLVPYGWGAVLASMRRVDVAGGDFDELFPPRARTAARRPGLSRAGRKFNFASVGIEARGRTSILRLNYRNTTEVLALALHCAQGLLQGHGPARG